MNTDAALFEDPEPMLADAILELEREQVMRERVYPRLIEQGKLKSHVAKIYNARLAKAIAELKALQLARLEA